MNDRNQYRYHRAPAPLSREYLEATRPAWAASRARVADAAQERRLQRADLVAQAGLRDTGQSVADLQTAARGTNATPMSAEFQAAFGKDERGRPNANLSEAWKDQFYPGWREQEKQDRPTDSAGESGAGRFRPIANPQPQQETDAATPATAAAGPKIPPGQPASTWVEPGTTGIANPPPVNNWRGEGRAAMSPPARTQPPSAAGPESFSASWEAARRYTAVSPQEAAQIRERYKPKDGAPTTPSSGLIAASSSLPTAGAASRPDAQPGASAPASPATGAQVPSPNAPKKRNDDEEEVEAP